MLNIPKHFMINNSIQEKLFELQKELCETSEASLIRRAINELYKKHINT